ncbi:MAG: IS1 family transposase [Coriobacteriaceae bacterium]|nr:MAG: IS1 family transposase [Coriobacteriaceae bacterium]
MSSNKVIVEQRARMDSMILQQIKKMGIAEKRELLERLKALIAKKMAGSALAGTPKRCPRCKSLSFYCKGHDACGLKRWKCCSCGKTFFVKTGSVLAMSKLTAATWAAYAKGTLAGMSLKGACEELPCEP